MSMVLKGVSLTVPPAVALDRGTRYMVW